MKAISKMALNAVIAGGLVFTGSAITELTKFGFTNLKDLLLGLLLGFLAAVIVFLTKLQAYLNPAGLDKKGKTKIDFFDFV